MIEKLLEIGLVALVWSGVGLVGAVIYFVISSVKDGWL